MEERIWHKAYAPGVPTSIDYEDITLSASLARTAQRYPDVTAMIMLGKKLSWAQVDELVNRLANALTALGIKAGDKVALSMPNMPQMLISAYAVWRLGATVVMVNPLYTEREMSYQLKDSGCTACVCMDLLVPRINKLKADTEVKTVVAAHLRDYMPGLIKMLFPLIKKELHRKVQPGDEAHDFMDLVAKYPADPPAVEVGPDDTAALLYTGGTTGVSKGVVLSHRHCMTVVQQMEAWFVGAQEGDERLIAVFPFFHVAGFTAMMNQSVYKAYTLILVPRPEPKTVLDMTKKFKPTYFGCVPTIYVGLLNMPEFKNTDFSYIKGCLSGAAPLAAETIREFEAAVGAQIVEVYGMTESATLCHGNPWGGVTKAGSVGVAIPDTDCKIVDVDDGSTEMPQGESGEIVIKGPQVFHEYYQKPEETARAIRDGWFHTGDVGYLDEEGYLFIVDRKSDMIIAGGYNIYPRDIHEVLYEHPKVAEACALGVPDAYRGETVKAFIVVKEGETVTGEELDAFCRERLAAYKVPKQWEFMDELPKSAIGKVLRRELKEMERRKREEGASS
jgi:long-chain acyl-CoA synthetase